MPDKNACQSFPEKQHNLPFFLLPVPSFFKIVAMNSRSVGSWLKPQNDGGHGGYFHAGSAVWVYMNIFVGQISEDKEIEYIHHAI
jgi:hypothetical protein